MPQGAQYKLSSLDYMTMLRNIKYFQNINLVLEGINQLNMPFLS
jgi:hypothetical protein